MFGCRKFSPKSEIWKNGKSNLVSGAEPVPAVRKSCKERLTAKTRSTSSRPSRSGSVSAICETNWAVTRQCSATACAFRARAVLQRAELAALTSVVLAAYTLLMAVLMAFARPHRMISPRKLCCGNTKLEWINEKTLTNLPW